MNFESITNHHSHETEWFSCLHTDVNTIRISVEVDDSSLSGKWLLKTHSTLTNESKLLNQLTSHQKRQWTFFFSPTSSRDTLFFDQYEQLRSKTDFMKIIRSQKTSKCRFLIQVVFTWSQGGMKGCIFEAVQVQIVVQPSANSPFKFSKPCEIEDKFRRHSKEGSSDITTMKNEVIVSTESLNLKAKDHRIYGKFMKMIEMGIPVVAVNQKLVLSNIQIPGGVENVLPNDPMPNPWLETHYETVPCLATEENTTPFSSATLRSVCIEECGTDKKGKKDSSSSSFTITLEQIASAIMSLRKTKFF
jgi:hypothetical protein